MTWKQTPSASLRFAMLEIEPMRFNVWIAATLLGFFVLGTGGLLLRFRKASASSEGPDFYTVNGSYSDMSSGLLNNHQLVALVRKAVLDHDGDTTMSEKISDVLIQEDRAGYFDQVNTPEELANLLNKSVETVSHDDRYQVRYLAVPSNATEDWDKMIYPISEHLSVTLPRRINPALR